MLPDLALIGRAGAGKTTAANLLVEAGVMIGDVETIYDRRSFASPLKDIAVRLWGTEAMTDRDKLQRLGVAVREIEQDTWLNVFQTQFEDGAIDRRPIVVDDCRFENEYWRLRELGFVTVRVVAEFQRRVSRLQTSGKFQNLEQLSHVSETSLDDLPTDYVLANDGTNGELYVALVDVLAKEARRS